ncbi:MAG TPA: prolyl oligopeptidase family serine peptidase [Acidimicrobiia bacterium]|nr:prolyl oligopeptidase family serine peptidase [Acidimicrobiia bacterium]
MTDGMWVGQDVHRGAPSEDLANRTVSPRWRLEDVWATARPHHPTVSPDGSTVAFILDHEGTTDLWLADLEGRLARLTTDRALTAYWEDAAPVWAPDSDHIAYNGAGWAHVVSCVSGIDRRLIEGSAGTWLDARTLLVVLEQDDHSWLAAVDIDDPKPRPLGPTAGDVIDPQLVEDGRVLATFLPKDDLNRSDVILIATDGTWVTLVGHPDRRADSARAHGRQVACVFEEEDRFSLFVTDLDGSEPRRLAAGDVDFGAPAWLPDGAGLVVRATNRGQTDLLTVDLDGSVSVLAGGGSWGVPHPTSGGVVATHESWGSPPRLKLVDHDGGERWIFDGAPVAIRRARHVVPQRVTFESLDGLEIEGYLFKPDDTSRRIPAVVYAHGGPTDHYGDEWDGQAQHFIENGYGWLAINFRGSTSYGLEFERGNHGECGVGDAEDCVAAGQFLRSLDWVDPDRVAIFGASYGSYLTLAALVHPENPFVCGVAKYGDFNMLTSWEQTDRIGRDEFLRLYGHPEANPEAYRVGSPIHGVPNLEVPILVAQGEKDPRVHPKQADELVRALETHEKTYEYVTYPTEAHGLLRREPQLHFYRRMRRFLDWHTR